MKLKSLLFLLMGALCWTSCSDDDPHNPVTPPGTDPVEPGKPDVEVPFEVKSSVSNITTSAVDILVEPNNESTAYFAKVVEAAAIENLSDDQVVTAMNEQEDFTANLHKDTLKITVQDLKSETDYALISFGWTEGKSSSFTKTIFRTLQGEQPPVQGDKFTASGITIEYTSAKMTITPNDENKKWFYYLMKKKDYDEYLTYEGEQAPVVHCYYGWNNIAVENGMNIGKYLTMMAYSGAQEISITNLDQDTEYVLMAMYVDVNNADPTIIYDYDALVIPFETLKSQSQAPQITIVDKGVRVDDNGYYNVYVTVKTNVAAAGKYRFSPQSQWDLDLFDYENDPDAAFTMANMMGRSLDDEMCNALTSAQGYTFVQQMSKSDFEAVGPMFFAIWVQDAQGSRIAKVVPVE